MFSLEKKKEKEIQNCPQETPSFDRLNNCNLNCFDFREPKLVN